MTETDSGSCPYAWPRMILRSCSDATSPDGLLSNPVFENVEYDLLSIGKFGLVKLDISLLTWLCIGNHELYLSDVAYLQFNEFSKIYGDRYLTSNVQILNPATGQFEYIGAQYRYFTTAHGKY